MSNTRSLRRWLVATLLFPCLASARDSLTLQAAVNVALARAPQVQAALAATYATEAGIEVSSKHPNPSLSLTSENFGGSGPYTGSRLRETTAMLELPLELGGKRDVRMRVASAEHAVSAVDVVATQAEIVEATTEAFVRVVEAQRRKALARERLALAEQVLHAAKVRVRAGKASPLDEQRAEVERVHARLEVDSSGRHLANASVYLEQLTGLGAVSVSAPWFDSAKETSGTNDATSPALAKAEAGVAVAQARAELARRNRIPDVTVSVGMRHFEEVRDTAAVVAISVPLPLFSSGAAELRRARAELDRAEALRSASRLQISRQLAVVQLQIEDARAAAAVATGPALAAASEAARIARIGYREGKFSQLDLIGAERDLNLTRSASIDALVAFHLARARLAELQGQRTPLYQE